MKLHSLVWSVVRERFNSVEYGVWRCPLVLGGLSAVLPMGVVAVVFWARLSVDMQGRRPCYL